MPPQLDDDLSLIGPDLSAAADSDGQSRLYQQELLTYGSAEAEDDEAYERKVKRAFHMRELRQIDEVITSRKSYANKIFLLVVCWLVGLAAFLALSGFSAFTHFSLDTKVLLALVGGTTLNVLGIFTIVANYLFPKNGQSIMSSTAPPAPAKPTGRVRVPRAKGTSAKETADDIAK